MRGDNILRWGASIPWAIMEESLIQMVTFVEREKLTTREAIDLVAAKTGRPLTNTAGVKMRDDTAVIDLIGPIFRYGDAFSAISGATTLEQLSLDYSEALTNPAVKAIVLNIDSPGGEAVGIGEFAAMVKAPRDKPVTAYVDGYCCSAAYWIASAADTIVAAPTAMVGSIGAIMMQPNPANKKPGDPLEFISSQTPLKHPDLTTEEGRGYIQERVDSLAQVFIDDVAANRNTTPEAIAGIQGAVLIAAKAQEMGLIDSVGTFEGVLTGFRNDKERSTGMPSANNRFSQFMAWINGEDTQMTIPVGEGATTGPVAVATEPVAAATMPDAATLAEMETLREQARVAREQATRAEALSFSKDMILAGRALPAEQADLVNLYMIAAADDAAHGPALVNGQETSRLAALKSAVQGRVAHTLVPGGDGAAKIRTVENVVATPRTDDERRPMDDERRNHLLSFTPEGRKIAARTNG